MGDEVDPWSPSDLDIAKYTQQIVAKYGDEIEFQQSTRNLIDVLFEQKTKLNYSVQLVFFLLGYVLPLLMSVFIAEEDNGKWACLLVSLLTICFFTLHALLQIFDLGPTYFLDFFNVLELSQFVVFFFYFAIRKNDLANYLPEAMTAEAGIESEVRRL